MLCPCWLAFVIICIVVIWNHTIVCAILWQGQLLYFYNVISYGIIGNGTNAVCLYDTNVRCTALS